jgi:hypothetical protein
MNFRLPVLEKHRKGEVPLKWLRHFLTKKLAKNFFPDINDENRVKKTHFCPLIHNYLMKNKIPVRDFFNIARRQIGLQNNIQW